MPDPNSSDASTGTLFEGAVSHHSRGDLKTAEELYRRVLAIDPRHADAAYNLGILGMQTQRLDLAADMIGQACSIESRRPEWQYHLALAHQWSGRLEEAARHYTSAVALKPDYTEAMTNLGNVFKDQGKLETAATQYEAVLRLKPGAVEIHYNLANVLAQQGAHAAAVEQYRRAVMLQPGFAEAHTNLGAALMEQGEIEAAVASHQRALALKPNLIEARANLGGALFALGRASEAETHLRQALALNPKLAKARAGLIRALLAQHNFTAALDAAVDAVEANGTAENKALFIEAQQSANAVTRPDRLRALVERALTERWSRPALLMNAAMRLLALNADIGAALTLAQNGALTEETLTAKAAAALAADTTLRLMLRATPITGIAMERLLTVLRARLLREAQGADTPTVDILAFFTALAEQCFVNNYVFEATPTELDKVETLGDALATTLTSDEAIHPLQPIAIAAYQPLLALPGALKLVKRWWPDPVRLMIERLVSQPLEERELATSIPALTAIDDNVSRAVRTQYEESPYPVWVSAQQPGTPVSLEAELATKFPHAPIASRQPGGARTDILIAGCGTGQQAVEIAQRYQNAAVLAVDLSLASLAYAKRQTQAQGIKTIEYAQADILHLGSIDRTFDLIVSTGVLHHLADPTAGLRVLVSLLKPSGLMLLGFYSALARQDVTAAQLDAAKRHFPATPDGIRRFRQELIKMPDSAPLKTVTQIRDFFSLSECRDLLFHVQEQQLTLPEISSLLGENGLEFLGFEIDPATRRAYAAAYPSDKAMRELEHWHAYEQQHPRTFAGMYQFWAQKKA